MKFKEDLAQQSLKKLLRVDPDFQQTLLYLLLLCEPRIFAPTAISLRFDTPEQRKCSLASTQQISTVAV
jgi:hypothetical protein